MADSVYDQAADEVASQTKTRSDAISTDLVPETSIPVRWLDVNDPTSWEDVLQNPVSIRMSDDIMQDDMTSAIPEGTNDRDVYAYPCHVFWAMPSRAHRDTRRKNISKLQQDLRSYFHNRRRMSGVSETNVTELPCLVSEQTPRPPADILRGKNLRGLTIWCLFLQPRVT